MKKFLLLAFSFFTLTLVFWQMYSWKSQSPMAVSGESLARAPKMFYGIPLDSRVAFRKVFKSNESLGEVLQRHHVPASLIHQVGQLPTDLFDVKKIKADKPYTLVCNNDSLQQAQSLIYHPNPWEYVILHFNDSVKVERGFHRVDTVEKEIAGVITSSLYNSMVDNGASPLLVSKLSDIYAWQIDFFGLQKGDAYKMVYEAYYVQGEFAGLGKIKSASFEHMDKQIAAYSFDQGKGLDYFDDAGNSLRSAFLKAPLSYSRISSHFSHSRLHPVLKIRRPHHGVDYAAPAGTPVQAVGNGVVILAKYSGGAGHYVKIKHNAEYTTGYMHLKGYGPGIREGVHVNQGDVIGYVGSTGLSTGPHLDFRFWKNGEPVDPLRVDPTPAEPIEKAYFDAFCKAREAQMQRLDRVTIPGKPRLMAQNDAAEAPSASVKN